MMPKSVGQGLRPVLWLLTTVFALLPAGCGGDAGAEGSWEGQTTAGDGDKEEVSLRLYEEEDGFYAGEMYVTQFAGDEQTDVDYYAVEARVTDENIRVIIPEGPLTTVQGEIDGDTITGTSDHGTAITLERAEE